MVGGKVVVKAQARLVQRATGQAGEKGRLRAMEWMKALVTRAAGKVAGESEGVEQGERKGPRVEVHLVATRT